LGYTLYDAFPQTHLVTLPQIHTIEAEDIRREKGTYTRDKNTLFLKNVVELGKNGNFAVKPSVIAKLKIEELQFSDIFAGPEPVFEVTKRAKGTGQNVQVVAKKKVEGKGQQATLDSWVKGEKTAGSSSTSPAVKKKTAQELEEEMRKIREQVPILRMHISAENVYGQIFILHGSD
jgi:hypothetical protein